MVDDKVIIAENMIGPLKSLDGESRWYEIKTADGWVKVIVPTDAYHKNPK